MPLAVKAVDAPPRWQWEASAGSINASQSNNCGPTCVCFIVGYYTDSRPGIEATRRLIAPCCVPTTGGQQAAMMAARGVGAESLWVDSLAQIDRIVGDGNHPMIVGIQMSRVPASVRDHPFWGWHAVVIIGPAVKDGVAGYWVMDPNFSPPGGHRPDPDKGRKFYSRQVMYYAYIQNWIRWSVVPNRTKRLHRVGGTPVGKFTPTLGKAVTVKAGKPLRDGASLSSDTLLTTARRRTLRLFGYVNGQRVGGYDRWYWGPAWINGRWQIVYSPRVDTFDYRSL